MYIKQYVGTIKALSRRQVQGMISTQTPDEVGDVVISEGGDFSIFKDNPIVLYGHDHKDPVGQCIDIQKSATAVTAVTDFAERPSVLPDNEAWRPDTVLALLTAGIVKSFSIGFNVTTSPRAATKGDVQKFGEKARTIISRWKLLEYSVVSVPCNSEALVTAIGKGLVTKSGLAALGYDLTPDEIKTGERMNKRRTVCLFIEPPKVKRKTIDYSKILSDRLYKKAGGI
jgi:hypothetical protein